MIVMTVERHQEIADRQTESQECAINRPWDTAIHANSCHLVLSWPQN